MSKRLLKDTTVFSINTVLSRISGFARDMVFAYLFGAGASFDAFTAAYRIPNFLRRLLAEGAFSQAFVPILSEYKSTRTNDEVRDFISHIMGALGIVVAIITVICIIASPIIIAIFTPGWYGADSVRFALASSMLRFTFPYLFFVSLAALCSGILNSYGSFGIPAFTSVLLNVVLIIFGLFISPFFHIPIYAVALGVPIGGLAQFVFQLPFLKKKNLLIMPVISFSDPGVRRVIKLIAPAIFGVSVTQIGILLDTIFASFLRVGSVSWLYYSDRLMGVPLGVFGVAIATVILPKMSVNHAENNVDEYSKTLDWALRLLLIIGLPASVAIFILAGPMMSTLFQGGAFQEFDVIMARKSLMAFAVGIQAFMLVKVLASGFYAKQNIKTPVKIAICSVIINIVFNIAFIKPLAHAGLALATSLAAFFNSGMLLTTLLRENTYIPRAGWMKFIMQLAFSNIAMGMYLYMSSGGLTQWTLATRLWRAEHLVIEAVVGFCIYIACLLICGIRPSQFYEKA